MTLYFLSSTTSSPISPEPAIHKLYPIHNERITHILHHISHPNGIRSRPKALFVRICHALIIIWLQWITRRAQTIRFDNAVVSRFIAHVRNFAS